MKEENQTIIKALNMYGRVPATYELLQEIERLNNIIKQIYEIFKNGRFEDDCDCIQIEEIITREIKGSDKE